MRPAPALPAPEGVDLAVALLRYEGPAAALVRSAKFGHHRDALGPLGAALGRLVGARLGPFPEAVTWVPAVATHRRTRGVDQGRVIAQAVASELHLPVRALLRRRDVRPQTGRSQSERLEGPRLDATARLRGGVLVVDDVRTTGASLRAAATALRAAGASRIVAATLAATPQPWAA